MFLFDAHGPAARRTRRISDDHLFSLSVTCPVADECQRDDRVRG